MNLTTTESSVLSISEATLRQPRFGYIPLLAIFLSNLLSNTAVAKYIPLGALRLSYDPIPLLKPLYHPTPTHHHYTYAPSTPVSSEEVQHFHHHHHLPTINQQQIVNIVDKKPTEIVVETDTEEANESSTENQEYRDDRLENPEIVEISDKSAKTLFKRGISNSKKVKSRPISLVKGNLFHTNHQKQRPLEIEVNNSAANSSSEDSFRIGLERSTRKEMSEKSVKLERDTYGIPSNSGHAFHPLSLMEQQQVMTLLHNKPTNKNNVKANEHQVLKGDSVERSDKTDERLLKRRSPKDHKMRKNQYVYALTSGESQKNYKNLLNKEVFMGSSTEQRKSNLGKAGKEISKESVRLLVKRTTFGEDTGRASQEQYEFETVVDALKSGEGHKSEDMSRLDENHTHLELEVNNGMVTAIPAENQDSVNIGVNLEKSGFRKVGDKILLVSDVDSPNKKYTETVDGNRKQEVREYESGLEKPIFEMISDRSMRALVKRGAANRYRVRKNNKYLYQKRRRIPDYYYDSYEDITTSRYYKPRQRPTRPRRPITSYDDTYDSNEDYDYDYPEVARPQKNRRRTTTTPRPRRINPKPTNRRRVQTTTNEYDDDDYAIEVVPRQGSTTITAGDTDGPTSTTPGSTSASPSITTVRPTTNVTTTKGYGYGPSHGHEGISITYGPPTGGGHGLYGPPSTSYGHPQTHYGPPSTNYGAPHNGFGSSSNGYYQVPFSDWYSNEVSRTAIAKKAQDIVGFENVFN